MRAALRVALVLALYAAAAHPVAAAEPTLGARISPVEIVYEHGDDLDVTNLSTIPVVVTLTATDGWTLGVSTLTLAVQERASVPITAAGSGDAVIRATLTPATLPVGQDAAALVLETRARHTSPLDGLPPALWLLPALLALAVLWGIRRRRAAS